MNQEMNQEKYQQDQKDQQDQKEEDEFEDLLRSGEIHDYYLALFNKNLEGCQNSCEKKQRVYSQFSQEEEDNHPDTWFPEYRYQTCCNGFINTCWISHRTNNKMSSAGNTASTNQNVCSILKDNGFVNLNENSSYNKKPTYYAKQKVCKNGPTCRFHKMNSCYFIH